MSNFMIQTLQYAVYQAGILWLFCSLCFMLNLIRWYCCPCYSINYLVVIIIVISCTNGERKSRGEGSSWRGAHRSFGALPWVNTALLRPNYSAHAGCYSLAHELCFCWPLRLDNPCTWNYYRCHLSSRRDDLRLSCLLTQTLMPLRPFREHCCLEWRYIGLVIWLHYIRAYVFSNLWVENHIFNKFKELDLGWYCQMSGFICCLIFYT